MVQYGPVAVTVGSVVESLAAAAAAVVLALALALVVAVAVTGPHSAAPPPLLPSLPPPKTTLEEGHRCRKEEKMQSEVAAAASLVSSGLLSRLPGLVVKKLTNFSPKNNPLLFCSTIDRYEKPGEQTA